MKSKFWFLTKESLNKKIKSKWFIVVNVILVALIIGLFNINSIINYFGGDFNNKTEIVILDNTNQVYELLKKNIETNMLSLEKDINITKQTKEIEELKKEIKDTEKILIVIDSSEDNYYSAKIVSNDYLDVTLAQALTTSINNTKSTIAISNSDINLEELTEINKPVEITKEYLNEELDENGETIQLILGIAFPVITLPIFMLTIFLVQMIGAEVNEEKTTRGMEIIISNVSPKVHFFSKVLAGNLFVIIQGIILIVAAIIGIFVSFKLTGGISVESIGIDITQIKTLLSSLDIIGKIGVYIPLILILIILTFIGYSVLAGVLASMTTNMEDFQQLQTPIMIISMISYYLAILSITFEGATFIKVLSYIPFISSILSPSLVLVGQIGIVDLIIATILMLLVDHLLIKYGLRIYKDGILNYSSSNLWKKMFKAIKNK